ncbi:MAG: hypothetical protein KBD78_14760 [Oligoflexales bacterium]|nr:hypothetical protein [Oligoflexales bacterium]
MRIKAELKFYEKRILQNKTDQLAIAEIKIWKIPKSTHYPQGLKYSLFLVSSGTVLVGFDNHKPKGPHLHLGNKEVFYDFSTPARLLQDFWELTKKAGYE